MCLQTGKNGAFTSYFVTGQVSSTTASSITTSKVIEVRYTALNSSQVRKPREKQVTQSGVQVGNLHLPNFACNEYGDNKCDVPCT